MTIDDIIKERDNCYSNLAKSLKNTNLSEVCLSGIRTVDYPMGFTYKEDYKIFAMEEYFKTGEWWLTQHMEDKKLYDRFMEWKKQQEI